MAEFETTDERWSIAVPGLRLEFRWTGDRWTHALEVGSGADLHRVATAIEGDADRDDPARVVSPAYQQIHFQRDVGRAVALLVGQSGPHHFSAAFAVREGSGGVAVEVDVADRCRAEKNALACTYRVELASGQLIDAGPACIVWGPDFAGAGCLRFEGLGPTRLALGEAGRRASRVQADAQIDPGRPTQRCLYLWRWTTPPT